MRFGDHYDIYDYLCSVYIQIKIERKICIGYLFTIYKTNDCIRLDNRNSFNSDAICNRSAIWSSFRYIKPQKYMRLGSIRVGWDHQLVNKWARQVLFEYRCQQPLNKFDKTCTFWPSDAYAGFKVYSKSFRWYYYSSWINYIVVICSYV